MAASIALRQHAGGIEAGRAWQLLGAVIDVPPWACGVASHGGGISSNISSSSLAIIAGLA